MFYQFLDKKGNPMITHSEAVDLVKRDLLVELAGEGHKKSPNFLSDPQGEFVVKDEPVESPVESRDGKKTSAAVLYVNVSRFKYAGSGFFLSSYDSIMTGGLVLLAKQSGFSATNPPVVLLGQLNDNLRGFIEKIYSKKLADKLLEIQKIDRFLSCTLFISDAEFNFDLKSYPHLKLFINLPSVLRQYVEARVEEATRAIEEFEKLGQFEKTQQEQCVQQKINQLLDFSNEGLCWIDLFQFTIPEKLKKYLSAQKLCLSFLNTNLSSANLKGLDCSFIDFTEACLFNANMEGCQLKSDQVKGTLLQYCDETFLQGDRYPAGCLLIGNAFDTFNRVLHYLDCFYAKAEAKASVKDGAGAVRLIKNVLSHCISLINSARQHYSTYSSKKLIVFLLDKFWRSYFNKREQQTKTVMVVLQNFKNDFIKDSMENNEYKELKAGLIFIVQCSDEFKMSSLLKPLTQEEAWKKLIDLINCLQIPRSQNKDMPVTCYSCPYFIIEDKEAAATDSAGCNYFPVSPK